MPFLPVTGGASNTLRSRRSEPSQAMGERVSERRAISVLAVEDDPEDIFILKRFLAQSKLFEIEVHEATCAETARQALLRQKFDVVFCDFWLGQESSVPLIQELAAASSQAPTMLLSSMDYHDLELISRRAGACGFVTKDDISSTTLDKVITSMLRLGERTSPLVRRQSAGRSLASGRRHLAVRRQHWRARLPLALNLHNEYPCRRASPVLHLMGGRSAVAMQMPTADHLKADCDSWLVHFDLMSSIRDVAKAWQAAKGDPELVAFQTPRLAVPCFADPTVMHDLLSLLKAEGMHALKQGYRVCLRPVLRDGRIDLSFESRPVGLGEPAGQRISDAEAAVIQERRRMLFNLASTVRGKLQVEEQVAGGLDLVMQLPLRPQNLV